jgi:hypothetical protein
VQLLLTTAMEAFMRDAHAAIAADRCDPIRFLTLIDQHGGVA